MSAAPSGERSSAELVQCTGLVVGHKGRGMLPAIDVEVSAGQFWAVIGRNGAGKTSWLRTLLGLLPPAGGKVWRREGLRMTYLPQRSSIDELYPLLAFEVVRMGAERGWSFLAHHRGDADKARDAMREMGVLGLAKKPFGHLSEGQKQRVLFARVAASGAELAVLDEPTSAMDVVAEREAFGLLDSMRARHGMAVLVVSHYLGMARRFADRAILLDRDSDVVVVGSPDEVFRHEAFEARYGDSVPPAAVDRG